MLRFLAFLLAALGITGVATAQVSVTGTVASTTVATGERFSFTVEVEDASIGEIEIPHDPWTTGLVAVSRRPSISRSVDVIDGEVRESVRYRWTYQPAHVGNASIHGLEVTVRGSTHRTEPINLTVVSPADRMHDGASRTQNLLQPDDVFIEGRASRTEAFVNELIIVEYRLFYREGVQLRQSRLAGSWDTPGFWREDMDVDLRPVPDRQILNGLSYNSIVLKRVAVYPTRDGNLRIEPFRIESEVRSRAGDPRDPFAAYRNRFRSLEIASNAIDVAVNQLPEGAPPSFSGAIGRFTFGGQAPAASVRTGDSYQITLHVSGSGNLAMIDPPEVRLPASFDRFTPTDVSRIDRSGPRPSGRRTFIHNSVPGQPGRFLIPPTEFTYFDPELEQYRTLQTDTSIVEVSGAALVREQVEQTGEVFRTFDRASRSTRPLHARPWAYAPLAIPLAAWLLFPGVVRLNSSRRERRLAKETAEARSHLVASIAAAGHLPPNRAVHRIGELLRSVADGLIALDDRTRLENRLEQARYAPPALRARLVAELLRDAAESARRGA